MSSHTIHDPNLWTPLVPELERLPIFGQQATESNRTHRDSWLGRAATWEGDTPIASQLAYNTAGKIDDTTHLELSGIRDNLGRLGEGQRALIEPYLSRFYDSKVIAATTGHKTVSEWLGDQQHGANDETLLDFLNQHAREVTDQSQSAKVIEAIDTWKSRRYETEALGVAEGWFSKYAGETVDDIHDVKIILGDVWDAAITQEGAAGYNWLGTKMVVVGQRDRGAKGEDTLAEAMNDGLLDHELNHVRFDGNKQLPRFEREGLAQHVALTIKAKGDRAEVIDPVVRMRDGSRRRVQEHIYSEERKLLALMYGNGYITINPKLAMRAYTSSGEDSSEFSEYEQCLNASWGVDDFRTKMAGMIDRREEWIRSNYPETGKWHTQNYALQYAQQVLLAIAQCQQDNPKEASKYADELLALSATSWSQAS